MVEYDAEMWATNGPGVITRVVNERCDGLVMDGKTEANCDGLTIFPPYYFYPIRYMDWRFYFRSDMADEVMANISDSHIIHVWNHLSKAKILSTKDDVAYTRVARQQCPTVFSYAGEFF